MALHRFKVPHFLDSCLIQEWVWVLGGVEVVGRDLGGAWSQLRHHWLCIKKLTVLRLGPLPVIPGSQGLSASWLW